MHDKVPQLAMGDWYAVALGRQQYINGVFRSQWVYYYLGRLLSSLLHGGFFLHELHAYEGMGCFNYLLDFFTLRGALLQGVHEYSRLQGVSQWDESIRFDVLSQRFQHSIWHCLLGYADW